jgi:tetratricopeptide (TPR) repeat protein
VEAYRLRGNEHFAAGLYRQATEAYGRAIDLLELPKSEGTSEDAADVAADVAAAEAGALAVCLANRAAAWLRRKQWDAALADCNRVLRSGRTDEIALKALFRRAKAHEGRGDADAARADFARVAELQPHNADAREEVRCALRAHILPPHLLPAPDLPPVARARCPFVSLCSLRTIPPCCTASSSCPTATQTRGAASRAGCEVREGSPGSARRGGVMIDAHERGSLFVQRSFMATVL